MPFARACCAVVGCEQESEIPYQPEMTAAGVRAGLEELSDAKEQYICVGLGKRGKAELFGDESI